MELKICKGRILGLCIVPPLLVAIAAFGCGGGSSEAESLQKPAFVEQANAICLNAKEARLEDSENLAGDEDDPSAEAEAVTETLVSPVHTMVEELGELGTPKGDSKQVEEIVSAFEGGAAQVEAEPVGPQAVSAFSEANELAVEYGLTDCTI